MKLNEDEVVLSLMQYLKKNKWEITSHCLGMKRGNDIEAKKGTSVLILEVKGAKANSEAPHKKREKFDSGQIKTHFGKAIVKIFEEKSKNPSASFAIAHPDDEDIRKAIGKSVSFLKDIGIKHFWVSENGIVIEE